MSVQTPAGPQSASTEPAQAQEPTPNPGQTSTTTAKDSDDQAAGNSDQKVGDTDQREVGGISGGIWKLILLIRDLINQAVGQHQLQEKFTMEYAKTAQEYHPDKNVLVVCTPHETNFEGFVDGSPSHYDLQVGPFTKIRYSCYIFEKGDLVKWGDGGYINWCIMGNYKRWTDGHSEFVRFDPINRDQVDGAVTPLGWTQIPKAPVRSHPDGVYFVDCKRGSDPHTEYSSGIAYYRNLKDGGNTGEQPDDYIDVIKGENMAWEKSGNVAFNNGTRYYWTMYDGAKNAAEFAYVGNADNKYNRYRVFKDRKHLLYTVDGWECYAVYWAY